MHISEFSVEAAARQYGAEEVQCKLSRWPAETRQSDGLMYVFNGKITRFIVVLQYFLIST